MNAYDTKQQWVVNDLCKVIVGFRNFTTHTTRSKYVSFAIADQLQMCELLVKLSQSRLNNELVSQYPNYLFEQLIDLGFLKPIDKLGILGHFKRAFNVLNSGRYVSIKFNGRCYYVASFVFMAFYSQHENDFLRETVVLPAWSSKFTSKVFDIITKGLTSEQFDVLPKAMKNRLLKHGLITSVDKLPLFERFFSQHCQLSSSLINELPLFYRNHLPTIDLSSHLYQLNPRVYLSIDGLDAKLRGQIPNLKWALSCSPNIWVHDPVKDILSMYWLTPAQQKNLHDLLASRMHINELDPETFTLFVYSGIVYDPSMIQTRREQWSWQLSELKKQLVQNSCFTFEGILSPIELAIARKYMRFMMDKKYLLLDRANGNTQQRLWYHRDEFSFYLQGQVCKLINQVLTDPVKPGHNALTVYKSGAILSRHKDDVLAFSWVMSLPVETKPEISKDQAWPIYVETPMAVHKAMLQSGDGHLINPQMPHWRDVLEDGQLSILLLWFVPQNFTGYVNGNWID
ncbi:hypothetical protein [Xenorhabdus cabanillasii]|uniref:Uncharacterized protein n=1 Tax=Xenorhabdus cabanillasii JM26 TaxID=1427517 RepID=W1IPZ4_9GAMM|nr:hypothetical protein [Xenorhabdus cabanillasii]PHM75654.1 hypothetical protein Xcab_03845 [Xenorhabdus cabanillasii JM26]CDL79300.1 conserved hypothetical protein [Xenorhabdus cabanillasii JM26]